jgi:hypothetical protein
MADTSAGLPNIQTAARLIRFPNPWSYTMDCKLSELFPPMVRRYSNGNLVIRVNPLHTSRSIRTVGVPGTFLKSAFLMARCYASLSAIPMTQTGLIGDCHLLGANHSQIAAAASDSQTHLALSGTNQ